MSFSAEVGIRLHFFQWANDVFPFLSSKKIHFLMINVPFFRSISFNFISDLCFYCEKMWDEQKKNFFFHTKFNLNATIHTLLSIYALYILRTIYWFQYCRECVIKYIQRVLKNVQSTECSPVCLEKQMK